jgi:hypothetical protein
MVDVILTHDAHEIARATVSPGCDAARVACLMACRVEGGLVLGHRIRVVEVDDTANDTPLPPPRTRNA